MPDRLGYVIVEFNQASHQPDIPFAAILHGEREWAEEAAADARRKAAEIGRGETYVVCEVVPVEDEDG